MTQGCDSKCRLPDPPGKSFGTLVCRLTPVAFLEVSINLPQRVFAAFAWSKSVTHGQEFFLKDRLYHPLDRRLHDSVFDCRDTQGARFTACFGDFYPPHRLGPVFSLFEVFAQFAQVHQFIGRKAFYALPIYACGSLVCFDLLPSPLQGAWAIDFVDQTEPFTPFDAVTPTWWTLISKATSTA